MTPATTTNNKKNLGKKSVRKPVRKSDSLFCVRYFLLLLLATTLFPPLTGWGFLANFFFESRSFVMACLKHMKLYSTRPDFLNDSFFIRQTSARHLRREPDH